MVRPVVDRHRGKVVFNAADAKDRVGGATFTVGAEATNAITVNVQLQDEAGNDIAAVAAVPWYLTSDAAGQTIPAAPSGGTAAGTDGTLIEWTAQLSGLAISEADGDIDIVITDTSTRDLYLHLVLPSGFITTSGIISFST
jgi:hypothetical protein